MHKVTRESDEYVCSCGLRWDTDEDDPHLPKCKICKKEMTPSQDCGGDCIDCINDIEKCF